MPLDASGATSPGAALTDAPRAAPRPPPALEVSGVTVAYPNGQVALRDASLRLGGPTICGLLGVNGSGKSSLFKAIMGMVRPAAGQVRIGGAPLAAAQRRGWVAYVPQSEEVDWDFPVSVRDVVMMGRYGRMGLLRIPRAADRAAVEAALHRVGMEGFADRQIGQLSGGQRKRVFLARALAQDGRVILLDEPFGGVDVTTQDRIAALLRELRAEGRIILVSTHDLAGVPELCDRVALVKGTVLAEGPVAQVFTAANLALAFGEALRPQALPLAGGESEARLAEGPQGETLVLAPDGTLLGRLAAARPDAGRHGGGRHAGVQEAAS
ncbi:metal ABC transporter ATP-binding protein [Roseomonas sp. OT10]|uniref:metal ABC transporter ATP-binding protein n=1 Tax=Roseomonas cutis TaxID=2897332 RepID=UPI001E5996AB|nr:metal ABC transporter ATP-binding protein [Roseomonas sp. OT10]UFN49905.1 metal ABC transporter ATP-binding protein [Roseomonas sp. OT10]